MATDWQRNQELDKELGPNQYGFVASVLGVGAVDGSMVARWQGDVFDVTPRRVYLGPWRPKPGITITTHEKAIAAAFASPVLWNAGAEVALSPALDVRAVVRWGSGSTRHEAWVDWPVGGLLLQVSGSYVEVQAIAIGQLSDEPPTGPDPSKFPDLSATLSDEPGGGDSARSATYTFPLQSLAWSADVLAINFPVAPFARAAYFEWDNTKNGDDPNYATAATIAFLGPSQDRLDGQYEYTWNPGDIGDPREGVPIPPGTAYIQVTFTPAADPADMVAAVGVSLELDL